jgi:hypothetical protein
MGAFVLFKLFLRYTRVRYYEINTDYYYINLIQELRVKNNVKIRLRTCLLRERCVWFQAVT